MARKHGGLGRGLDALIPMREEVEKAMSSAESEGVEILFADDEEDLPAEEKKISVPQTESVSRETFKEDVKQEVVKENKEEIPVAVKSPEVNADDLKEAVTVRISEVEPNRKQPRKTFDLKAGLKEVPVIIRDYTEKEILELSLIENIQRENLNPIEEAQAYKRLMDEFGLGQADVAQRVSKSRPAVANSLRLLKLEENVQKMLIDGKISMGHARALLSLEIPEEQLAAAQKVVEKELSVRETEKLVKELLKTGTGKKEIKPVKQKEDPSIEIIYRQIEERLQQTLHTKVSIQRKRNGHGKLLIDFYNSDDLEKIIDRLTDR